MDLLKRSSPDLSRVFYPGDGFSNSIFAFLPKRPDLFTKILGLRARVPEWLLTHVQTRACIPESWDAQYHKPMSSTTRQHLALGTCSDGGHLKPDTLNFND